MALIGCLILMVISPAGLSAMTPFVIAAFSAETHRAQADALLILWRCRCCSPPDPAARKRMGRSVGCKGSCYSRSHFICADNRDDPAGQRNDLDLDSHDHSGRVIRLHVQPCRDFQNHHMLVSGASGIGFALVGVLSSFANALFSPLFQWLIYGATNSGGSASGLHQLGGIGWSGSYFVVAATIAVLGIPSALFLISEPAKPSAAKRLPMPGSNLNLENAAGIPLKTAIRTKTWIFITLFLAITAAGPMTVRQNSVDFFQQRGFDLNDIAFSQSVLFVASVVGLFLGGMILDRSRRPWVIAPLLAMVPIGLTIAYFNHGSVFLLYVAMSSLGFATGAESALGPFLVARYFGPKAFAQIQGLTLAICSLSFGLTPFLTSAMATAAGSYFVPFAILTGLTIVAVALGALLPNYPPEWPTGADVSGK